MEITYDLIIEYLVKNNKKTSYNFITQKNIYNYSNNFTETFKNIFIDKFYRYGITINDNENNNISFWSSLLTLLFKDFLIPYENDEISMINNFKTQLLEKYNKLSLSKYLKDLDKNDLIERIKLEPDIFILQYIVDILDINFIVCDFLSENIYIVYANDIINPFKSTLIFANYKNIWEPIMLSKNKGKIQRLFSYNDNIIKKLFNENIDYYQKEIINKNYIFENINSIITFEKNKLYNDELLSETTDSSVYTEPDVFINNNDILKNINKTKLNKMKLNELLELTNKLNLNPTTNPTRTILINLIYSNIINQSK